MAHLPRLAAAILLVLSPSLALAQPVDGGRFGRGLKVGATYAAAEHNPIYIVSPLTVELWARVSGKAEVSVLLANEPRNSKHHWELYTEKETGRFAVGIPGYVPATVATTVDVADDAWHHLAYVNDGKEVRLYVDGKESAKAAVKQVKPFPDTGPLHFGFQVGVAPHVDTTIDDVRISRVAREFAAAPDKPYAADADTVGLWHFDDDAKAIERQGGLADASATASVARLKSAAEGTINNGGFDNTVGGKTKWSDMDYGPFFSSTITPPLNKANVTYKGVSIRLGKDRKHAVTFDTELLRMSAAWEGPFIKIYPGRDGLGNHPEMGAKPVLSTSVGPGWIVGDPAAPGAWDDPRATKMGPLSANVGHYHGLHVYQGPYASRDGSNGDSPLGGAVLLSYSVGGVGIRETFRAGPMHQTSVDVLTRLIYVEPSENQLTTKLCEVVGSEGATAGGVARLTKGDSVTVAASVSRPAIAAEVVATNGRIELRIPPHRERVAVVVSLAAGDADLAGRFADEWKKSVVPGIEELVQKEKTDPGAVRQAQLVVETLLQHIARGGDARYPDPIPTKGTLGKSDGPYAVDTLTAPDDNPWNSFLRFGGHDFFKNGDAAICSVSGDVWVVSGIDDKLDNLKWRRFATGLFQPLGLKIVDDKVYVLGRDQITRLHDYNNDGEADFYENFNNDGLVTTNGHAYVACLERDPAGNFYYIKCGDKTPHGGTVLKISPDGKKSEVHAVGIRNANGLGMSPAGVLSEADNQGDWVPASRIDLVTKPMQFLGYPPMSKSEKPPTDPGKPLVWMPQNVDNSAGGQTWVEGDKWGLPAGSMLHTSYGQASLLHVMPQTVKLPDGTSVQQAAVHRFPLTFATGIMRGRFRPQDGQLYVSGLRGWQTNGTNAGALQRVRYTGKPIANPVDFSVHTNGVKIAFGTELDKETAADVGSWSVLQWNYRWTSEYGSKHWSVKDPQKQGFDTLEVKRATLLADGKTVFLEVPGLTPVMQMRVTCNLDAKDGSTIRTDVYNTVHGLGEAFRP